MGASEVPAADRATATDVTTLALLYRRAYVLHDEIDVAPGATSKAGREVFRGATELAVAAMHRPPASLAARSPCRMQKRVCNSFQPAFSGFNFKVG